MPFGINVFSFGLLGRSRDGKIGSADAEPSHAADVQRARAIEQHDTRNDENPLEHREIFQWGFFPIY